uniref:EF-hand domain-containing protein n=1 Tax=Macrostomum lignano TaxID=282301 RepID=A0A1I8FI97_9PLAT
PKKQLKKQSRPGLRGHPGAHRRAERPAESEPLPEEETQRRPTRIRFQEGTTALKCRSTTTRRFQQRACRRRKRRSTIAHSSYSTRMDPTASMPESFTAVCRFQARHRKARRNPADAVGERHGRQRHGICGIRSLMSRLCKPEADVRQQLVSSFQVFDKDQSGYLDAEELRDAIYSMGPVELSEEEFDELLSAVDKNGDGRTMKSLPRFF